MFSRLRKILVMFSIFAMGFIVNFMLDLAFQAEGFLCQHIFMNNGGLQYEKE